MCTKFVKNLNVYRGIWKNPRNLTHNIKFLVKELTALFKIKQFVNNKCLIEEEIFCFQYMWGKFSIIKNVRVVDPFSSTEQNNIFSYVQCTPNGNTSILTVIPPGNFILIGEISHFSSKRVGVTLKTYPNSNKCKLVQVKLD